MLVDRQRGRLRDLLRPPLGRSGGPAGGAERGTSSRSHGSAIRWASTSPCYVQYYDYMGRSFLTSTSATATSPTPTSATLILDRLPATIWLVTGAVIIWLAIGIPVGIISAVKRRSLLDRTTMITSLAFISAPVFWLGLVALYLFAQDVGVIHDLPRDRQLRRRRRPSRPSSSRCSCRGSCSRPPRRRSTPGTCARSMIDVMSEDYIRTARAKGLPERAGDHAPRRAQRDHPDRHAARARRRRAARRQRDPHRDRLQHPRRRAAASTTRSSAPT